MIAAGCWDNGQLRVIASCKRLVLVLLSCPRSLVERLVFVRPHQRRLRRTLQLPPCCFVPSTSTYTKSPTHSTAASSTTSTSTVAPSSPSSSSRLRRRRRRPRPSSSSRALGHPSSVLLVVPSSSSSSPYSRLRRPRRPRRSSLPSFRAKTSSDTISDSSIPNSGAVFGSDSDAYR